jgi:hypothetical protein
VAVLLGADLYEFSWRYQLPALVTLPVAGAFGVTALVGFYRARRQDRLAAGTGGAPRAGAGEPAEVAGAVEAADSGESAVKAGDTADELAVAGSEQGAP